MTEEAQSSPPTLEFLDRALTSWLIDSTASVEPSDGRDLPTADWVIDRKREGMKNKKNGLWATRNFSFRSQAIDKNSGLTFLPGC